MSSSDGKFRDLLGNVYGSGWAWDWNWEWESEAAFKMLGEWLSIYPIQGDFLTVRYM